METLGEFWDHSNEVTRIWTSMKFLKLVWKAFCKTQKFFLSPLQNILNENKSNNLDRINLDEMFN